MIKPQIIDCDFDKYLQEFERYNVMIEDFLIKEFYSAKSNWNLKEPKTEKEIKEFISTSREALEHTIIYPQSFRTSLLVQLFSLYEKEMKDICLYHHYLNKTDFSVKDLKGNSDIQKAKLYLTKSCEIDFNKLNPEWNFLETIRKIRNLIVHSKGDINQLHQDWNSIYNFVISNKDLLGFLQCIEYTDKDEFDELYTKDDYFTIEIQDSNLTEKFIKTIRDFFKKLISEMPLKE